VILPLEVGRMKKGVVEDIKIARLLMLLPLGFNTVSDRCVRCRRRFVIVVVEDGHENAVVVFRLCQPATRHYIINHTIKNHPQPPF
jgi:hypothetical protein